jgi:hypothetical protein
LMSNMQILFQNRLREGKLDILFYDACSIFHVRQSYQQQD